MSTKYVELESSAHFNFGLNDAAGAGDGTGTPAFDVRESGATAGDAPIYSGSAVLLTHANYPLGSFEVAIAATAANGFVVDTTYSVWITATINAVDFTSHLGDLVTTPLVTAKDMGQLIKTTVATVDSQTQYVLTAALGNNNAGVGCGVMFIDANGDPSVRRITAYTESTKTIVINAAPDFTVVAGDGVVINGDTSPGQVSAVQATASAGATAAALVVTDTAVDAIQTDLSNATDGLGALKTLIDAVNTDLSNGTDGLGALKALIDAVDVLATAIKVPTDKLIFTLANELDVNTKSMNDVVLLGAGVSGDKFRGTP